MTHWQNFVRVAALGSAMAWGGVGLADPPARPSPGPSENRTYFVTDADSNKPAQEQEQAHKLRGQLKIEAPHFKFYFMDANAEHLGVNAEPADESVRAQLGIPDGQGVVLMEIKEGSVADKLGLKVNDILLRIDDTLLANVADFIKAITAPGDKAISIQVLRGGKTISLDVKPEVRKSITAGKTGKPHYQLGIQTKPLEASLRAQLDIPDEQGVLVRGVESGSAAEKAGLKPHDILLSSGDQPLKGIEDLVEKIQKSDGKPLSLKVLRGGKSLSLEVTPDRRDDVADHWAEFRDEPRVIGIRPSGGVRLSRPWQDNPALMPGRPFPLMGDPQIGDLRKEVRELRKAIERLQKSYSKDSSTHGSEKNH